MPTRLETLLELTLRTSTANVDPFKDDLRYVSIIYDETNGCLNSKMPVVLGCIFYYSFYFRVELLNYDLITMLFKILSIETKQEKGKF